MVAELQCQQCGNNTVVHTNKIEQKNNMKANMHCCNKLAAYIGNLMRIGPINFHGWSSFD